MNFNNLRLIYSYIIIIMIDFCLRLLTTSIRTATAATYYDTDKNKDTKVGIVGAAGFIGSALGNYLSEVGFSVRGFDRNPLVKYQKFEIIKKRSDQIDTYEIAPFDVVVYLGGSTNRERIEVMSTEYIFDENVNDILVLVRKMKPYQLLIFASTSGILEGSGKFPIKECGHVHISKLDAYCGSLFLREQMLMKLHNSSNSDKPSMIGIRFGTVVGASPRWRRSDSFIHSAFKSAYSVGIIKLNNPDVYNAYLWNKDLVEAISKIIYKKKSFQNVFEIYHLQSVSASMLQVATAISLITDAHIEVIESSAPSSLFGLSMDSSSFERRFAFKPNGTLQRMLKDYNQNMMSESNKHSNIANIEFEIINRSTPCSVVSYLQEVKNSSSIVEYSNIGDTVVPNNFKEKLQFYVITLGHRDDCGGCKVLLELIRVLDKLGYHAVGTYMACPSYYEIEQLKILNKTAVFLYPEIFEGKGCCHDSPNMTHVRWILAPLLGMYTNSWGRDDLVFTYGPGVIHRPLSMISNTLMVMENPKPNDETDIPNSVFYNKERSGILWIKRKAFMFHKHLEYIHNQPNLRAKQNESLSVLDLRNCEYFVSYDPYSYWSFLAAMSGAVSVVFPLHGVTKEQWTQSIFFYEYLQITGKRFIPGIAYGWVKSELEFARETMHELRAFLIDSKKWGEQVTVDRFARDCYRHTNGMRSNFEAAGLVRDFFPIYDVNSTIQ